MLVMLAGTGVPSALTRAKAKWGTKPRELYAVSLLIGLVGGAIASIIFLLGYLFDHGSLFAGINTGQALAVCLLVPPLLILSHWNVIAYLDDHIVEYQVAAFVGSLLLLVGVAAASVASHLDASRTIAIWAFASFVPFAIVFRISHVRGMSTARALAPKIVRYAVTTNIASVALILAWRLDVFLVKGFRGAAELGYYAVAVGLAEVFLQFAVSFRVALTPLQGAADNRGRLVDLICFVTRLSLIAGAVVVLLVAVAAPLVVRTLYGTKYAPAAEALRWLTPGIVALVAQGPLIDFLLTEGKVRGVTLATGGALCLNVALDATLLPGHNFVVAALASTAAYTASCVACLALFQAEANVDYKSLLVFRTEDLRRLHRLRRQARS